MLMIILIISEIHEKPACPTSQTQKEGQCSTISANWTADNVYCIISYTVIKFILTGIYFQ